MYFLRRISDYKNSKFNTEIKDELKTYIEFLKGVFSNVS